MIQCEVPVELHNFLNRDFAVVGIGNEIRGDDGVGVYIAKAAGKIFSGMFLVAGTAIENYVFKITGFLQKRILLIDSVDFGERPGYMKLIPLSALREQGISTHSLSLNKINVFFEEAGKEVMLLGIQGKNMQIGGTMSPDVKKSAENILDFFCKKLNDRRGLSPSLKCTN
ncbi:MAG: hydrogenase maturation protease [bacterium]